MRPLHLNLVLVSLVTVVQVQSVDIGCFTPGECLNSLELDYSFTNYTQGCLDFCQGVSGCQHFTLYLDVGLCFALGNCAKFNDTSCTNCISGDVDCGDLQCFISGHCDGVLSGFDRDVQSSVDCLQNCKADNDCHWWTYDSSDRTCFRNKDCSHLDQCETCQSGQKECSQNPSSSTTTTSTSSSAELPTFECGQDITMVNQGYIVSPGYPNPYPNNIECSSTIVGNQFVRLEFEFFQLEGSSFCTIDYIELHDGPSHEDPLLDQRLCPVNPPLPSYVSSGPSMTLEFNSDATINAGGFSAKFTSF